MLLDGMSSRVHCEISNQGHQILLTDLKSSNGTFVNENAIRTSKLYSGDRIRVGTTVLEVRGVEGRLKDEVEEEPRVVVESSGKTRMMAPRPEGAKGQEPQLPGTPADKPVPDSVSAPQKISLAEFESMLAGAAAQSAGHELVSGVEQGILGPHPLAQDAEPTQVIELGKLRAPSALQTGPGATAKAKPEPQKPAEPSVADEVREPADVRVCLPPDVTEGSADQEPVLSVWEPAMKKAKPPEEAGPRGESPSEIIFEIPERTAEEREGRTSAERAKLPPAVLEAVPGYRYEGEFAKCITCGRTIRFGDIASGSAKRLDKGYECPKCAGTQLKTPEGSILGFTDMQSVDVATVDHGLLKEMEGEEAESDPVPPPSEDGSSSGEPG
jgi:pSer/pThr/pTyr-binding forkhead associated (FHA) protein/DNA-directed RNA polymerase subunit RPC12/RpoP